MTRCQGTALVAIFHHFLLPFLHLPSVCFLVDKTVTSCILLLVHIAQSGQAAMADHSLFISLSLAEQPWPITACSYRSVWPSSRGRSQLVHIAQSGRAAVADHSLFISLSLAEQPWPITACSYRSVWPSSRGRSQLVHIAQSGRAAVADRTFLFHLVWSWAA